MSKVSRQEGDRISFKCPCGDIHSLNIGTGGWGWNGNLDFPTFTPSILSTDGHFAQGWKQGDACWCTYNAEHPDDPVPFKCGRCHSFITDGRIQFLPDCSHSLANQTVEIPEWEELE